MKNTFARSAKRTWRSDFRESHAMQFVGRQQSGAFVEPLVRCLHRTIGESLVWLPAIE
jgi:hypothetical protein